MTRSDDPLCKICVSGPEGLHRRNGRVLLINDVKFSIGGNPIGSLSKSIPSLIGDV
jgi:hypothetical protein